MKKEYILIFSLLLVNLVFAANYTYEIKDSEILVKVQLDEAEYLHLPFEYRELVVQGEYFLEETELYLFSAGGVNYSTKEYLEKTKGKTFFILEDDYLNGSEVQIILPEGSILSETHFIHPKDYTLTTNGKNIILSWEEFEYNELLIPYLEKKSNIYLWIIPSLFLLGLIIWYFYLKSEKNNYSKNLFREEKSIVNYLLKKKNHSCWTKEISKELDISKVRLSRKLRNLVEKGIILKEPYGNENKISLKK
jgi:predicted transcriptional regulator